MVDNFNGITIYSYEGRQVSNPKFQGLRTEFLNHESISVSNDTLAVIDRSDSKGATLSIGTLSLLYLNP